MKTRDILAVISAVSLIAACGGGGKKPGRAANTSTARAPEPPEESEPEPPVAAAPKLKEWHAKAALTPVKGAKQKPALISFSQREGDDTSVESEGLEGAKPGTYWLVVHEGDSCGPNATKAGAPWPGAGDTNLRIVIEKDLTGGLEANTVRFALGGDVGVIGHVLVLHDDKKGKPGKALACGVIEEVDEP